MKTAIRNSEAQAVRSSVLQHFQRNPFRALRLAPNADVSEGLWRVEQVLAMRRAGLAHPEPDLLPWLPELDEVEIQQAAQRLEEPFERLLARLFWFDLESDPGRDLLRSALAAPCSAEAELYLALVPSIDEPDDPHAAALAVNAVNLLLLRAAAVLHRVLPPEGASEGERPAQALAPLSWRAVGSVSVADEPHKYATDGAEQNAHVASWRRALNGWRELLSSPALHAHLQIVVRELDDELIGEDDIETIQQAILARLVDLVVAEIKAQQISGRHDNVRALIEAATSCQLDVQMWRTAFRPLRSLFQAEIAELGAIPADAEAVTLADLELHVARLEAMRQRWTAVDPQGHLGLGETLDQAVRQVWRRLGSLDRTGLPIGPVAALMGRTAQLAGSSSLAERIQDSLEPLNSELSRCNYCHRNEPDLENSAILERKREVDREESGNTVTVHYRIRRLLIPRCRRCAELHHHILFVGWWVSAVLTVAAVAVLIAFLSDGARMSSGWGALGLIGGAIVLARLLALKVSWYGSLKWTGIAALITFRSDNALAYIGWGGLGLIGGAVVLAWLLAAGVQLVESWAMTPPGEHPFNAYKTTNAYREMISDGSYDAEKIKCKYSRNAARKVLQRS